MSKRSRIRSGKSRRPSGRMSTSQPWRMVICGYSSRRAAISSACLFTPSTVRLRDRRRARRMVRDRHVLVAERAAAPAPSRRSNRVRRSTASACADRRECRGATPAPAARRGSRPTTSSVAVPDFRRDERQSERRVDRRLRSRTGRRMPVAAVQAVGREPPARRVRVRAQGLEVRRRSGQVEQRRARVRRVGQAHPDLHPIGQHVEPAFALMQHAREVRRAEQRRRWRAAGCELAATISMSPTVSWPRRSDPAGSAQSTPGTPRSAFEHGIGNRDRAAERHARNRARSVGSAAAIAASSVRVHAGDGADQLLANRPRQVRAPSSHPGR